MILGRTDGIWLNEPKHWSENGNSLEMVTDSATDFWRETHYGFVRDNGHFLGFQAPEAFTAEVRVQGTGRCGRRLSVSYTGNQRSRPVYRCDKPNLMMGLPRGMTGGGCSGAPHFGLAIIKEFQRRFLALGSFQFS